MRIKGVLIEDTFAEAFPMWVGRLIVTADTAALARQAVEAGAGLATSIIGCSCEAGLEGEVVQQQTPDGRPGQVLLLFSHSPEKLEDQLFLRISQAILPSATSACFNGMVAERYVKTGGKLRYFGDGFQSSKLLNGRRFWRIPVADGEFLCEESFGMGQGVGGGNLLIMGKKRLEVLKAAEAAAAAARMIRGVITPFPGGVCRSPSKPGAKYPKVRASTNQAFCPTLRSRVKSRLNLDEHAAYEIVIDGLEEDLVVRAMKAAMLAACQPGVLEITAGNYGGKWGPYHFHLHKILKGKNREG